MERGIGTSRGIGIGHVLIVYNASAVVNRGTHYNADEEKKRFFEARKTFIEQTEELLSELEKKLGESDKDALVLKNQIYLARDITTENEVVAAIDNSHICAEAAFDDVCNKLIQLFSSMDNPDMQQRVTDIQDMRERMIQILQGTKAFDLTNLPDNTVIVADEIKPSMTASMDIAHVAGIVAEKGGDTAHASILARALEIPAVLSVKGILQKVKNGDSIIIDGAYGEVFINPTQRTFSIYEKKKKKYEEHIEELKTFINKSTETADGKKVAVVGNEFYVNAAEGADAEEADADVVIQVAVPAQTTVELCSTEAQAILSQENCIAVFGSNQVSAEGVLAANANLNVLGSDPANGDVVGVGFDAGSIIKAAVKDGTFIGAVTQSPLMMGYYAIYALTAAANGQELEDVPTAGYWYDSTNIDDENIAPNLYD